MSNNTTANDKLTYALQLTAGLHQAILYRMAPLGELRQQLEDLDGRTCTGNAHWRDKDTPGKTAKLYILHGIDQACPVHGQPKPGGRLRTYIGSKPDCVADALAAIEREIERRELYRKTLALEETIERTLYRIKDIYRLLGRYIPEIDDPTLPPLDFAILSR